MKKVEAKNYNFSNVKYFSPMQLSEHYVLYTRYIDCLNKIKEDLNSDNVFYICNPNYSEIRSIVVSKSFCYDAVKLHELYFENLTGNNTRIHGSIETLIIDIFGSYNNFIEKFKCIALSMRGWVSFCYDHYNDEFYVHGQDSHDNGVMLYSEPIIVLDVYEHAYMIDYGINRGNYIDAFFANLDYSVVNNRLSKLNF